MLNAVDNLFRQTAAVQRADLAFQLLTAGADRVAFRQEEGHAQRTTARDNRHFVHRIVFRHKATDNRVARFVVRGRLFLRFRHHHGATFGAHHDFVFRFLELNHRHYALVAACGKQRRFVDQFAVSAPEKPGVPRAMIAASISVANGTRRICTFKICSRPRTSGRPTTT